MLARCALEELGPLRDGDRAEGVAVRVAGVLQVFAALMLVLALGAAVIRFRRPGTDVP